MRERSTLARRVFLTTIIALAMASSAVALQTETVRPNGEIRITAAISGVTRLSVEGDRIRRLVHEETEFEVLNDGDTGDVFLRYSGPEDKLVPETGYIITESGHTISYTLTPKMSEQPGTVLVKLIGVETDTADRAENTGASGEDRFEFASSSGGGGALGGGDGYASQLVAFTRAAIDKHVVDKTAPRRSHGTSIASFNASGLRGRVLVAAGGSSGRYVRPQEFYGKDVVAVWVEKNSLAAGETAWVIVVEARR